MTEERSCSTRVLYAAVSSVGAALFFFGSLGSIWAAVTFVQVRTGWGITPVERCCTGLGKASLGGILASVFFVLVGSGVILLLHPIRARSARRQGRTPARWLRWFALLLLVYAAGVFSLATAVAGLRDEFESFTVGLVTYCMLVGVGMLAAAWGFKRASEAD